MLQDVGVHYRLRHQSAPSLANAVKQLSLGGMIKSGLGGLGVTALEQINLELKDGDRLGLLGHNGAGKSTLLRVMAGILPPTTGRVRSEGRVSALLSINTGLDAEATGRANIWHRARHMGCRDEEIDAQLDGIVAFSELGHFLDLPMKTYSSGMKLRLAFAIATAFQPEILLLDEWLSAGDATFQKRASKRLNQMIENSGIFAFASHNISLQRELCTIGVVLQNGKAAFTGPMEEAIEFAAAASMQSSSQ